MDGNTSDPLRRVAEQEGMAAVRLRERKDAQFRRDQGIAECDPSTGGVLQAADDPLAAVERFEREPDDFKVGVRVRDEFEGRLGTVEARHDEYPLWPVGVRWDDGSYEPCSVTELRVVEAVSL
jgi:hypothetical protein